MRLAITRRRLIGAPEKAREIATGTFWIGYRLRGNVAEEHLMAEHFDAAVIGAGQAGPPLVNRLTKAGKKVAMIERSRFGGTCVNTGCMPTKTLVASAYAAHIAARAADYGIMIEGRIATDMKRVKARKDRVADTASKNVEDWLKGMPNCTIYRADARLTSPHDIEVGSASLTADMIFLDVGARAVIPKIPGIEDIDFLTNETVMQLETIPPHLMILGGSYIGLEFAQIYRRFGADVTIIEAASRLLPREDEDISAAIHDIIEAEGVHVHLGSTCTRLRKQGEAIGAEVATKTGPIELSGSHLLLAIGRRPNTDSLGLDAAGVNLDPHGYVAIDDFLRTNVPSIYALGECNGHGPFTHTAYNDFEIVAANLLDGEMRRVSDRIVTYGLFIDPPLGRVGLTEAAAREAGHKILLGKRPMTRVGRAIEKGETKGFMKVLVDADTNKILGATILGTGGDEAVHCVTAIMYADAPYTVLQRAVQIHPTIAELIPTVLGELAPL
jgi:pyruvate/2-oxoglutarate dehydrogenase complex dihydrolipoamide dehydrogenase (E3) component